MAPDISVVVPSYRSSRKRSNFFPALLKALEISQLSYELIVIDDASPIPITESEIFACGIENAAILRNVERRGVNFSRNKGIALANSQIIFLLDFEDIVEANLIIASFEVLTKVSDVKLTGGCYREFRNPLFLRREVIMNPKERRFLGEVTPNGSGMAFRKSEWFLVGGFNEEIFYGGTDREFGLRVLSMFGRNTIHIFDYEVFHQVPLGIFENFKRSFLLSRGHVKIIKSMPGKTKSDSVKIHNVARIFNFNSIDVRKSILEEGFFYFTSSTLGKLLGRFYWSIRDF